MGLAFERLHSYEPPLDVWRVQADRNRGDTLSRSVSLSR